MEQVALGWLVFEITDSPFMLGIAAAARMAPFFFLGVLSGAVADRVDRQTALRVITVSSSVVPGLMALLLLTRDLVDVQVWYIVALAAGMGAVWAFSQTLRQAYTYDIVGRDLALNGLSLAGLSQMFGQMAGAVLAGALIGYVGVGGQYLFVGGTYLAAFVVLLGIQKAAQGDLSQGEPVIQQLLGYIRLLRGNRTLLTLMGLTMLVEIFGFTHQSLLPVFAKDELGVGALGLGIMLAVRRGGAAIGLILLASLGNFKRKGVLMFVAATAFGLGQMAFSLAGGIIMFVIVLAFVNAAATTVDTLHKTLMQANVPDEQRGRAMGSWVLSIGVAPVGHIGLGAMAGALGAPGALLINGSILTFVGITAALGLPRMRRLE
jgi:MFS family permease